jgi:hypothetical protein
MRGALKRRRRAPQVAPQTPPAQPGFAVAAAAPDAQVAAPRAAAAPNAPRSKCGLLTCPHCGLGFETLTLRCPRCRADIPLGCEGNCSTCGKA